MRLGKKNKKIYFLLTVLCLTAFYLGALKIYKYTKNFYNNNSENVIPLPEGYTTYGPYDKEGIPLVNLGKKIGSVYHPLVVAEFGSYYDGIYRETGNELYKYGLKKMADWLVLNSDKMGFWQYDWNSSYGGINTEPPWVSAVVQGFAAQTLLKAKKIFGDEKYLDYAEKALLALDIPIDRGGVKFSINEDANIFEEISKEIPTHILNGHLTALIGLYKLLEYRNSTQIQKIAIFGLNALVQILPYYDTGYWSRYDMLKPILPKTQAIILAAEKHSKSLPVINYDSNFIKLTNLHKIDVSDYTKIEGILDTQLDYFIGWIIGDKTVLDFSNEKFIIEGDFYSAYLTWNENKKILIPFTVVSEYFNIRKASVSKLLFGHATGMPYHRMMTEQLYELSKLSGNKLLNDTANRWNAYFVKYGERCAIK